MLAAMDTRKMVDEIALSLAKAMSNQPQEDGELMDLMDKYTQEDELSIAISFPRTSLNDEELKKLNNLIASKGPLIQKALDASRLEVEIKEDRITFPWFERELDQGELMVFSRFIEKLMERAKDATTIHPEYKHPANEKYAFRCFLLRLDYIGDDFKEDRKMLLKNFTGSSAFRNGDRRNENAN